VQKQEENVFFSPYSCTVHLDAIESFIYPTDAQLDCSKMLTFTLKFTCESINNPLKYVVYRISSI